MAFVIHLALCIAPGAITTCHIFHVWNPELESGGFFYSSNRLQFLNILELQTDILQKDLSEWVCDITFNRAHGIETNLIVVNDNAERCHSNHRIQPPDKNGEEQKQYLLQDDSEHRKIFPDYRKKTLKHKKMNIWGEK